MTSDQANQLAEAFAKDGGAIVIKWMLENRSSSPSYEDRMIEDVMRSLEELAEHYIDTACCLMLSLWPLASHSRLHHICDSIDLWISTNRSETVSRHLKSLVSSTNDVAIKRHFEGLQATKAAC
jgi:hypothetical protein